MEDITKAVKSKKLILLKSGNKGAQIYFLHWEEINKIPLSFNYKQIWSWTFVQKSMFGYWGISVLRLTSNQWHNLLYLMLDDVQVFGKVRRRKG